MDNGWIPNEEYRRIREIFDSIDENYILRWFYRFILGIMNKDNTD